MTDERKTPLYLDYHATTPCDPDVLDFMMPYFSTSFGNPHAINHCNGRMASNAVETAREKIADLLHCDANALTLTSGATEANNIALFGLPLTADRNEILLSAFEHASIRNCIPFLEQKGFIVKTIPISKQGFVTANAVKSCISNKTILVSVMAVNHEIGTIQPLAELAEIAHEYGALFHTDATQGVGKTDINIDKMNIDMLSLSGHKFYGPCGIGALYIRPKPPINISPIIHGGRQQKMRSGTVPLALSVGLGEACLVAKNKMVQETERLGQLGNLFLDNLFQNISGLKLNGARQSRLSGSFNLCFPNITAREIVDSLYKDICISSGSACATKVKSPSYVLQSIDMNDEDIFRSIRISFGRKTSEQDVLFAIDKLSAVTKNLNTDSIKEHNL